MRAASVQKYTHVFVRAWDCRSCAGDAAATWAAIRAESRALRRDSQGHWLGLCSEAPGLLPLAIAAATTPMAGFQHQRPPAFACAASKGDLAALETALDQGLPPPLHRTSPDAPTMALARHFGLRHIQPVPTVAACSTGLATLLAGADRLEQGFVDEALVGAVDRSCTPLALAGFHAMHVLCGSRDPSVTGHGFAPAEGAGFLALARQGPWRLVAGVRLGEANHETRCDDADILAAACSALWESAPPPDLIIVHGTGTNAGDAFEAKALAAGPWKSCPQVRCKPIIGHALGASSAVELSAALEAPVGCLWKLGMGFGGHVTAVALQRH